MSKHDLRAPPVTTASATSIKAHLTVVFAALVASDGGTISARSVRFTQDSAGKNFKDGRSVMELVGGLSDGSVDPSSFPPIRIFNDEQGAAVPG